MQVVTILVDIREKKPLPFPDHLVVGSEKGTRVVRLLTRRSLLETGDYVLAEAPALAVVERKANFAELHKNLLTPVGRARFDAELHRLQPFAHKWLFLEGDPHELSTPSHLYPAHPACVRDTLLRLCLQHRLHLLLMPVNTRARKHAAGEWIASLLYHAFLFSTTPPTP